MKTGTSFTLALVLSVISMASSPNALAAGERIAVSCSANYKMFGHKIGSDRPDECGTVGVDGPAIGRIELGDTRGEMTIADKFVTLNIQVFKTGNDIGGMIRYRVPGRETYSVVVRGLVTSDAKSPLSLHSYLGETTMTDKPDCSYSRYLTVNCFLAD